jgi:uncharacterized protein (DUF983 family)
VSTLKIDVGDPRPRLPAGAGQALWRGLRGRCPACGEGRMFRAFL